MLVKFFHRGRATSDSALAYLLSEAPLRYLADARDRRGVIRDPAPAVVKGHPALVRQVINQCPNKNKYTSGVLSCERLIAPKEEAEIVRKFEATAFSGLQSHQYHCLWIRHSHLGRTELHFLVPRTELTTLKALNINPPRLRKEGMYDVFRKLANHEYNLRDPSGVALSPAERARLEQKLASMVAARAAYNRSRYPVPAHDKTLGPLTYEDRTRSAGGSPATPRCAIPAARPGHQYAVERLGVATRTLGQACGRCEHVCGGRGGGAHALPGPAVERADRAAGRIGEAGKELERAGNELGRATQALGQRLAERAAAHERSAVSGSLFSRYGIPVSARASAARELERGGMERDLSDDL